MKREVSSGFRRILYDAMVLSSSLKSIRNCSYYEKNRSSAIDGNVEANHTNALIQIRSMLDFLNCEGMYQADTMHCIQFFGCNKHSIKNPFRESSNKYVAHKSWDAVNKDAKQIGKKDTVKLGMNVLDGFFTFWNECQANGLKIKMNKYAKRYETILRSNYDYLKGKI